MREMKAPLSHHNNLCITPSTAQVFENRIRIKPLWDVNDVAEFLQVSPRTVRDWVYKQVIPYRKAGTKVRFKPEEIEKWTLP